LLLAAGTAGVLLLLYKHSFMRQDIAHVHMGPMVATAVAILYAPPLWRAGGQRVRLACVIAIVIAAGVLTSILSAIRARVLPDTSAASRRARSATLARRCGT
jgi:hypothetical protein